MPCARRTIVNGRFQQFYSSVFAVLGCSSIVVPLTGTEAMAEGTTEFPANANSTQVAQATAAKVVFVHPEQGSETGNGTEQSPYRTLTQALNAATPNTLIQLAPGTYSPETGEVFPLQLKPDVTIQGDSRNRGQNIVIRGGDFFLSRTFARQNVTIVGANRARLVGVTVSNPHPQGYGLWTESTSPIVMDNTFTNSGHDGASVVGSSAPLLRNNYFYQNGANGITIYGTSRPELQDNIFEQTGFGINVAQNAAPRITGNRITQNKDGVVIQGSARPMLRNNVIDGNSRDGIVAISQSRPDLGTAGNPGHNTFLNNRQFDINAQKSSQNVPAFGNQISTRTIGRLDFSGMASVAEKPTNVASTVAFGQALPIRNPEESRPMPQPTAIAAPTMMPSAPMPSPVSVTATPSMQPMPISVAPRTVRVGRSLPQPRQPRGTIVQTTVPSSQPSSILLNQAPSASLPLVNRSTSMSRSITPSPLRVSAPMRSSSTPIEIPVPAPESSVVAPRPTPVMEVARMPQPVQTPQIARAMRRSSSGSGLLPVPRGLPPVGNVRGSSVPIWRGGSNQAAQANRAAYPFRVVVATRNEEDQARVRTIVPDAFWTSLRGQRILQAGAFQTRSEADGLLQLLINQGLPATIEQL
jgi:parallel beta-helix repeat protein